MQLLGTLVQEKMEQNTKGNRNRVHFKELLSFYITNNKRLNYRLNNLRNRDVFKKARKGNRTARECAKCTYP